VTDRTILRTIQPNGIVTILDNGKLNIPSDYHPLNEREQSIT
jgi:hypothetical protein